MASLPRIFVPLQPLFVRDAVEVALITVEVWPNQVVVRLAGLPSEVTADRQRRYESELEHWGPRRRFAGEDAAGQLAKEPGELLLSPLEVTVHDDAGTAYVLRSSSTGGTGTEWRSDWNFIAQVPESTEHLSVVISSPEGEQATVQVDFGA